MAADLVLLALVLTQAAPSTVLTPILVLAVLKYAARRGLSKSIPTTKSIQTRALSLPHATRHMPRHSASLESMTGCCRGACAQQASLRVEKRLQHVISTHTTLNHMHAETQETETATEHKDSMCLP
jgi:hypothetical protein